MRIFHYAEVVFLVIMTTYETTKYLCMSSGFIGISSIVLYSLKQYELSFLWGVLCITSVNLWRDYKYGSYRHFFDLLWVKICIGYGFLSIFYQGDEFHRYVFLSVLCCITLFFIVSKSRCKYWVIFHMSIHLYISFFAPFLFLVLSIKKNDKTLLT